MSIFSVYKSSKLQESVLLEAACHSMSYHEATQSLYVLDSSDRKCHIYNSTPFSLATRRSVDLSAHSNRPVTVGLSSRHQKSIKEVLIACESNEGVQVFDSEFNFIRKFGEKLIDVADFMETDTVDATCFVYISAIDSGKLIKLNGTTGEQVGELNLIKPCNIRVRNEELFVISNGGSNSGSGNNCVLVFNKNSLQMKRKVFVDGWMCLEGLHFDSCSNLIVTAKRNSSSQARSLFVFDSDGNLINEIVLDRVYENILDITVIEDNLVVLEQESDCEFVLKRLSFNI
jgi:hypothetical protein